MIELILKGLGQIFGAIIGAIVLLIKALISNVLLVIANIGFMFLDFIQAMFRRLAGLPMDGRDNPDLVQNLLSSDIIKNTIIALTILAVCLLFIATFVQLARVEFTEEGAKNSKMPIITQALKAFAMFVIVPVTCMLGVFLSNLVLRMVDSATSGGNSKTISGLIFKVGAYDANIIREGNTNFIFPTPISPQFIGLWVVDVIVYGLDYFLGDDTGDDWVDTYAKVDGNGNLNTKAVNILPIALSGDRDNMAAQLDDVFASDGEDSRALDSGGSVISGTLIVEGLTKINYTSIAAVRYFYNIMEFNFLMVFLAIPFAMKALFNTCFGLVMRIYNVLILFVISPPLIALMPLDGGNAYKGWRQKFIGNVVSAYGTVAGLNLFFQILPLVNEVEFFETNNPVTKFTMGFYNSLAQLLFVLVGCYMIQDISKMISGFIGAEDAQAAGEGMAKKIGEKAKKAGMAAVAVAGLAVGGGGAVVAKLAAGAAKAAGGGSEEAAAANQEEGAPAKRPMLSKIAKTTGKMAGGLGGFLGKKIATGVYGKLGNHINSNAISEMGGDGSSGTDNGAKKDTKPPEGGGKAKNVEKKGGESKSGGGSSSADQSANPTSESEAEVKAGNSNGAVGSDSQADVVDKYGKKARNSYIHSQRGIELAKNLGIQLIAGSGMGKAMNEMTGGMFKVFGGKGINQMDGAISSKSDLNEQMMFYYNKGIKQEKQQKHERSMGDVYEVMQAMNQRTVNREMAEAEGKRLEAAYGDVRLRQEDLEGLANAVTKAKRDKGRDSDEYKDALDNFHKALSSFGFKDVQIEAIDAKINSNHGDTKGIDFDANAITGEMTCKIGGTKEPLKVDAAAASEAIHRAVQNMSQELRMKVDLDGQAKSFDGLVKAFTQGLSKEKQKEVGAKSLGQMNLDMRNSAVSEKSERGDLKAILKILQSKL